MVLAKIDKLNLELSLAKQSIALYNNQICKSKNYPNVNSFPFSILSQASHFNLNLMLMQDTERRHQDDHQLQLGSLLPTKQVSIYYVHLIQGQHQ